jgi:flagellar basal body-associated protein FliL
VSNPFKILIVVAVVIAVVLVAGFTYVVFLKNPGKVSRSLISQSVIEPA